MTKTEAIQAMQEGKKVTHQYFDAKEWMTMSNGMVVLEDGVVCTPNEFWHWRTVPAWNDGYELFKNKQ